jgi:hypothetical protein
MHSSASVSVVQRFFGWELVTSGTARPVLDWFLSRDRALAAALRRADELQLDVVALVTKGDTVECWVNRDGGRYSRYSQAV